MLILATMFAAATWAGLFLPPAERFWWRSLGAAAVLTAAGVTAQAADGRLGAILAPVELGDLAIGGALAVVAIVAVRLGYPFVQRTIPAITDRADDLFALRRHASPWLIGAAALAMGIGEEAFFRGLVQARWGMPVAVGLYTVVQLAGRNWLLVALGVVGGTVWGLLYAWTGSLVAPVLSHGLPIAAVAVWPPRSVRERYPAGIPPDAAGQ